MRTSFFSAFMRLLCTTAFCCCAVTCGLRFDVVAAAAAGCGPACALLCWQRLMDAAAGADGWMTEPAFFFFRIFSQL